MRGIKITTKSSKRTIHMCHKCYEKETDEITLAIEYSLIQRPTVTDVGQCEMHCQEIENGPAPARKRRYTRR